MRAGGSCLLVLEDPIIGSSYVRSDMFDPGLSTFAPLVAAYYPARIRLPERVATRPSACACCNARRRVAPPGGDEFSCICAGQGYVTKSLPESASERALSEYVILE